MSWVALGVTAISAGISIYQGVQANNAAKVQAKTTRSYADMQQREADIEAARIEDEGNRFAQKQKMLYIGSGVEFGGSAVITIAQTKKWAKEEADATRRRGVAMREYGYQSSKIQEGQGRAALIGGISSAVQSGYAYGESKNWDWSKKNGQNT